MNKISRPVCVSMLFVGQFDEEKDLLSAFKNPQQFYMHINCMQPEMCFDIELLWS